MLRVRVERKQIMLAFVFLKALLAPGPSEGGQMLNVRKMFAINVLQWPHVQNSCKSNLGNKAGGGVVYIWYLYGPSQEQGLIPI